MSRSDSTQARAPIKVPKVPDDFPLNPHLPSGQWRKTIKRKDYYFGKLADWRAALEKWEHDSPYLFRGQTPPPMPADGGRQVLTLVEVVNRYVASERSRFDRRDVGFAMYDEAVRTGRDGAAVLPRDNARPAANDQGWYTAGVSDWGVVIVIRCYTAFKLPQLLNCLSTTHS